MIRIRRSAAAGRNGRTSLRNSFYFKVGAGAEEVKGPVEIQTVKAGEDLRKAKENRVWCRAGNGRNRKERLVYKRTMAPIRRFFWVDMTQRR